MSDETLQLRQYRNPRQRGFSGDGESMLQSTLVTTSLNIVNLQMEGLLQLVAKLCDERDVQVF